MKRLSRIRMVTIVATVIGIFTVGYAVAQMSPGMMGGGGHGQAQQHGQPMGPGMMGHGMMGPGGMMGGGMMGARATNNRPWITVMLDHREELGLSNEQVGRLFTLRDQFAKEARRKSEALETAERDLDQLLGPGPADLGKVEPKLREIEAMRMDLRLARIKVVEQGKAVLTPEQRQKFVALAKQFQQSSGGAGIQGTTSSMEEMHRFMHSERGAASMNAMMEMARRMGGGDVMLGMQRMMEMMGNMGGMGHMMGPQDRSK